MRAFFKSRAWLIRMLAFLLVLSAVLSGLSCLAANLGRNRNPLYNYSTTSFFAEPRDSIDVLAIGTSNVYSSVEPLEWWHNYGFTGFTWGEASQRIFETYEYLKRIYAVQSPRVVLLEIGDLYRDDTRAEVLDSLLKSRIAAVFPIVTYHRNLGKLSNLGAPLHSVTKGYLLRTQTVSAAGSGDYMADTSAGKAAVNALCAHELARCVALCRAHGSQVVLLSIPDRSSWNDDRHTAVAALAEQLNTPYLDLNLALRDKIDWKQDTADGGVHLNYRGAQKVTDYLGAYLAETYPLPDHRSDTAFRAWDSDWTLFSRKLQTL